MNRPVSLTVRFVSALLVNAVLFTAIPALHNLFGAFEKRGERELQRRRVVAEVVRPPEEEKRPRRRRIRRVKTTAARSGANATTMRFTPDLGTAGGASGVAMESRDLEAMVFNEGETDEDLIPVRITPIQYPGRARELGIEGTLDVEIIVGRDGKVESVDILTSPHPSISAAARRTIARWRFKPAKNKGIPVRVRARQAIEFKLD
jgi:protein TonB